ncbi:MAG: hypothetical protein L0Y80_13175 [Ignavibacteriae bacterium]|nr:hypothetical protein [Ignavibacteriota bacterium]
MRIAGFILFTIALVSCDGGLAPIDIEPGFGGTITFEGAWPPQDSLVSLWLVASQDYPLDSLTVISGIISNPPRIYVYPSLTENLTQDSVASVQYSFFLPPAEYKYIAVVQRINQEYAASSLRIIGLYGMPTNPSEPRSVTVTASEFFGNIDITANFYQLPPQPF